MIRILILGAAVTAILGALSGAFIWARRDAQADLLRELQLQQANRTATDTRWREAIKLEIENATDDELWSRACRGGMLPADACAGRAGR